MEGSVEGKMGQLDKLTCSEVTTEVSPDTVEGSSSEMSYMGGRELGPHHPVAASQLSHGGVGTGGECFLALGSSLWQRAVPF